MQSTAPSLWLVRDHGWASRPELLLSTPLPAANLSHELRLICGGLELPLQAVRQLQDELEDAPSRPLLLHNASAAAPSGLAVRTLAAASVGATVGRITPPT